MQEIKKYIEEKYNKDVITIYSEVKYSDLKRIENRNKDKIIMAYGGTYNYLKNKMVIGEKFITEQCKFLWIPQRCFYNLERNQTECYRIKREAIKKLKLTNLYYIRDFDELKVEISWIIDNCK